ncbi:hypothetical protein Vafri_10024 [Volvox africanus]|uniref:Uncharacterized protein n=1 Tax=Volvox africanus TaxID=51714 RepID=A0A8J4B679_9CHLO|nr:hypothetical protein Vafri_10024 [Volvox africanus]
MDSREHRDLGQPDLDLNGSCRRQADSTAAAAAAAAAATATAAAPITTAIATAASYTHHQYRCSKEHAKPEQFPLPGPVTDEDGGDGITSLLVNSGSSSSSMSGSSYCYRIGGTSSSRSITAAVDDYRRRNMTFTAASSNTGEDSRCYCGRRSNDTMGTAATAFDVEDIGSSTGQTSIDKDGKKKKYGSSSSNSFINYNNHRSGSDAASDVVLLDSETKGNGGSLSSDDELRSTVFASTLMYLSVVLAFVISSIFVRTTSYMLRYENVLHVFQPGAVGGAALQGLAAAAATTLTVATATACVSAWCLRPLFIRLAAASSTSSSPGSSIGASTCTSYTRTLDCTNRDTVAHGRSAEDSSDAYAINPPGPSASPDGRKRTQRKGRPMGQESMVAQPVRGNEPPRGGRDNGGIGARTFGVSPPCEGATHPFVTHPSVGTGIGNSGSSSSGSGSSSCNGSSGSSGSGSGSGGGGGGGGSSGSGSGSGGSSGSSGSGSSSGNRRRRVCLKGDIPPSDRADDRMTTSAAAALAAATTAAASANHAATASVECDSTISAGGVAAAAATTRPVNDAAAVATIERRGETAAAAAAAAFITFGTATTAAAAAAAADADAADADAAAADAAAAAAEAEAEAEAPRPAPVASASTSTGAISAGFGAPTRGYPTAPNRL